MVFEGTEDRAPSSFVVADRWQVFPGSLHSGALYMVLIESMNWSSNLKFGRMELRPERRGPRGPA